jgi:hypothetical protein
MSTVKHAKLAEYIQQHKKNWDLDFMVVMPGEAGKQLFGECPLSDQSVVARAYGRKGGKAGKGTPKTGGSAKGMAKTGKAAKGMAKTGKAAKGAAHWRAGVIMETAAGFSSRLPAGGVEALKGVSNGRQFGHVELARKGRGEGGW